MTTDSIIGSLGIISVALLVGFAGIGGNDSAVAQENIQPNVLMSNDEVIELQEAGGLNLQNLDIATASNELLNFFTQNNINPELLTDENGIIQDQEVIEIIESLEATGLTIDVINSDTTTESSVEYGVGGTEVVTLAQVEVDDTVETSETEDTTEDTGVEEVETDTTEPEVVEEKSSGFFGFFKGWFGGGDKDETEEEGVTSDDLEFLDNNRIESVEVVSGVTVWDLLRDEGLSVAEVATIVEGLNAANASELANLGVTSGDIDLIYPGETIAIRGMVNAYL